MLWGHESSRIFREYGCLDLGKQQQSYYNYRSEVERDFYAYVWTPNQKVYIVIELQVLWMKVLYVHKSLNRKNANKNRDDDLLDGTEVGHQAAGPPCSLRGM